MLKLRSNAKKCFDLSLDLAESLRPKDLSGERERTTQAEQHMPVPLAGMRELWVGVLSMSPYVRKFLNNVRASCSIVIYLRPLPSTDHPRAFAQRVDRPSWLWVMICGLYHRRSGFCELHVRVVSEGSTKAVWFRLVG